jgi:hypothetical protein
MTDLELPISSNCTGELSVKIFLIGNTRAKSLLSQHFPEGDIVIISVDTK